ncbi:MAG: NAD-dependent epimerase/dehydratase family protein [Deltaproteobacteria bacterium]|nr:MAG: NAD-dependent epimerase/dehydratase family protein [Deltaproteobacteria bacterium]
MTDNDHATASSPGAPAKRGTCLVTGAGGFIGSALIEQLRAAGWAVRGSVRDAAAGEGLVAVGELGPDTDWRPALAGCDVVVHAAARAHRLREEAADPLAEFRRVNVAATLALAAQAQAAGVRRFVFISSIGVNGSINTAGPFSEEQPPAPAAAYAVSKLEAEEGLRRLLAGSGMELVILRPTLVYAARAPGNFARLLRIVAAGLPLPLAGVRNRRSLLALENLLDFIGLCCERPEAAGQLFVVADGEALSTPELIRCLAAGMGRPARLWPCPDRVLRLGAQLTGRLAIYQQLCGDLEVDIGKARRLLAWSPPHEAHGALQQAARHYLENARS